MISFSFGNGPAPSIISDTHKRTTPPPDPPDPPTPSDSNGPAAGTRATAAGDWNQSQDSSPSRTGRNEYFVGSK